MIYDYTKSVLERSSFDQVLFRRELKKAVKVLLPYEMEQLTRWLAYYTNEKPDLKSCLHVVERMHEES